MRKMQSVAFLITACLAGCGDPPAEKSPVDPVAAEPIETPRECGEIPELVARGKCVETFKEPRVKREN